MKKTLLLVDDSSFDVELVLHVAERVGISDRTVVARDGLQALDYLVARRGRPALILLDLHMPGADGFDVLKVIRTTPSLSDIPVVVMSSSLMESDQQRASLMGVDEYIVKSHDLNRLAERLTRLRDSYLS